MNHKNINTDFTGNGFHTGGLGAPGSGFGSRPSRFNSKRLSVALPPKVASINEHQNDVQTPRTSRSHLLTGLRTQPKAQPVPASAPYHQSQHSVHGLSTSRWADENHRARTQGVALPQTATAATFDASAHYGMNAGRQIYALPEQVLAPPNVYEQTDDIDPNVLQQMQLQHMFLAQRQQQLQQQLANITAAANTMSLSGGMQRAPLQVGSMMPQQSSSHILQQQHHQMQLHMQSPIEIPGQPGVYLVYNPALQTYTYAVDQNYQQTTQEAPSIPYSQSNGVMAMQTGLSGPVYDGSKSLDEQSSLTDLRSFTPPKRTNLSSSPLDYVEPLPPPSATAFRRGHKKASSLAIHPSLNVADGPKTSSAATFGTQRSAIPPPPMTGTFGPGAARAGEHPIRQPRGPPPLEELMSTPTNVQEGSKNFAARQRRRALDNLMKAGTIRRGVSRSSGGSPVSEREAISPVGSEGKGTRGSQGSDGGYFGGLSSASSSESEDLGFKNPPTPATPATPGVDSVVRKKMMLGVLNAAEKRKSYAF